MKLPSYLKAPTVLAAAAFTFAGPLAAQTSIVIPNGNFSSTGNQGTKEPNILGLLGNYNEPLGSAGGPWSVQGTGISILGVLNLLPPTATINTTNATFGGLVSGTNVLGDLLNNGGRVYQNNLTSGGNTPKFVNGTTYLLTAQVTTNQVLNLGVLTSNGFGIGLLAGGDLTASSTPSTGGLISISLLSPGTYTVSLQYTADADDNNKNIGVEGFVGRSPNIALNALGTVAFDNFTLSTVVIPEPSAALLLGAAGVVGALRRRRI